jgi:TPR repeat protein
VILEPRLSLVEIFRRVGDQVRKSTLDDQIPWFESSLNEDYYFQPPEGIKVAAGTSLRTAPAQGSGNAVVRGAGAALSATPAWYRTMSAYEWSNLDYEIQQRFKSMTPDELPVMEHRANGGSVVAQTTLGLFWLAGAHPINTVGGSTVSRYGANNTKGLRWLRKAADAGFPVAQAELGERLYQGQSTDRDTALAQRLLASAAQAEYPRAKLDLLQIKMQSGNATGEDAQEVLQSMMNAFKAKP